MSVSKKYALHSVTLGANAINQIKSLRIQPGVEKMLEFGSGVVDPTFVGIDTEQPMLSFTSTAIKKVLAAVDLTDGFVVSGSAKAVFYFKQMAPGGTRLTGNTALKVEATVGIAVINGIAGQDGTPAVSEVLVYVVSADGETAPLTYTANVAVPALAAADQLYTTGPAAINGTAVGAVESFSYEPKFSIRRNRGDGEGYPTFAYIQRRGNEQDGPSIRITTRHLEKAATSVIPITTTTTVALRAMKAGAVREPLASSKHIVMTAAGGTVIVDEMGATDGDEGLLSLDIAAVGTPPISIAVDQALA